MEDNSYNSLTDKLIQNGILSSNKSETANIFEKYYEIEADENYSNSPFEEVKEENTSMQHKRRINEYDLDLIKGKNIVSRNKNKIKRNVCDIFLLKFFPRIYRAKVIKKAMKKIFDLNIDTKTLFNKTIPYGENEIHYSELIKYLKYANELQVELRKND